MSVSFDSIPSTLRVPLAYIEFNNTRAVSGTPGIDYKLLVIGQKSVAGTMPAETPVQVTSAAQADKLAGTGSMLATMLKAAIKANGMLNLWAIALDDLSGGNQAAGSIKVAVSAPKSGTLVLYVGGVRIPVGVSAGDSADAIATAIKDAVNASAECAVTATAVTDTATFTAKWKGETGNAIDIRDSYFTGEARPEGVTLTITAMTGGSGNPNINDAIDAFGAEWWNAIVMPYTDTANLNALRDDLVERWGPMKMIDGIAFAAITGDYSAVSSFGGNRNDWLVSVMDAGESPTPPWIWAAVNAAVAAGSLSIDPARPLQTLPLPGILPPALVARRSLAERNLLLHDGISTNIVDAGGNVLIERQVTTYQKNPLGAADPSYLDVNTPATLSYLRYSTRTRILLRFPRYKLASDDTRIAPGQAIVTPRIIKAELLALANEWQDMGLVEDLADYKATLIVERNANDPNRVDVLASPNLINQFRLFAEQIQFIL